ncbi:small metal-binding protein SmbP [Candidatus Nitrospira bockiana]
MRDVRLRAWVAMASSVLVLAAACAFHDPPYVAEALQHANQAISRGLQADANGLAEQATVALRYAYLAERDLKEDPHLAQAIQDLKQAVLHARYGRSDEGAEAAERAAMHLAEIH